MRIELKDHNIVTLTLFPSLPAGGEKIDFRFESIIVLDCNLNEGFLVSADPDLLFIGHFT